MENKTRLGPIKEIIIFGGSRPRMFGISQSPNSFCVSSFKCASILLHSHLGQHAGQGALDTLMLDRERCKFPCPACRPKMNLCPQARHLNSSALYFLENSSKSVPKHTNEYVAHIHADTFQNFSPLPLVCILPLHVPSILSVRRSLLAVKCFVLYKYHEQVVRHMGERATSQQCPSKVKMSLKSVKNIGMYKHIHTRAHTQKHTVPVICVAFRVMS